MEDLNQQAPGQAGGDAEGITTATAAASQAHSQPTAEKENISNDSEEDEEGKIEEESTPQSSADLDLVKTSQPTTDLERALYSVLARKERHIAKITNEITKLQSFMSKRKQTYKRKRKPDGAPTRALSAYNLYIRERFAELAKSNEDALKNEDSDAALTRVPPANIVADTGNKWKELSAEEKRKYEERAKEDRLRYKEQMAQYQPPDKASNRKRNKTGYNMFFTAHVQSLRQTVSGVPSERGSVARIVGESWKRLTAEEREHYERQADELNAANSVDDDDFGHEQDRYAVDFLSQMHNTNSRLDTTTAPLVPHMHHQHDPRNFHPPPGMYAQSYYDYSQHHQRHTQPSGQAYRYPGYEG